jgi:CspA family cold shock protein
MLDWPADLARTHMMSQPARTEDSGWHNQPMTSGSSGRAQAVAGVVEWFDADQGWGVVGAPEVPGGCFVHFANIDIPGYRELHAGQHVMFTFERPGFLQDGCPYRALTVWPAD